ncbi:MAG: flavin reductase family protein [Alphaproteobacteria bacterium]
MAKSDNPGFELRQALGRFATGVTIVTASGADGNRVGLTVNSFASVSLDPPLILWSIERRSPSLEVFQTASHFCVNVLAADQEDLCRRFSSPQADKFDGISYVDGLGGSAKLPGSLACFECRNHQQIDGGDHIIVIGAVETFSHGAGDPLVFLDGKLVRWP